MNFKEASVIIDRPNLCDEDFWYAVEIWWTKPNCVNKRACGADFPNDGERKKLRDYEIEFIKAVCSNFDETNVQCRRLLPKNVGMYEISYELQYTDKHENAVVFLNRPVENKPEQNDDERKKKTSNVEISYAYSLRFDADSVGQLVLMVREEDANAFPSAYKWLVDDLTPTLARWMKTCQTTSPLKCALRLVDLEAYNDCYNRLKAKYGKPLVKMWPERTDPKKFVYEDIGIAAYLLTLWRQERETKLSDRMQSFVDLGCGNGLLVYLLSSENHPGYGIDVRKRDIWNCYGPSTILLERAFEPSDEHLFPDADWIIGNHSDELTPWIPVIAAKSSVSCNFFVLPCCPWDFKSKFQRRDFTVTTYREYLRYVRKIGDRCGFVTDEDMLKIPSTKRTCIIGKRDGLGQDRTTTEENIKLLLQIHKSPVDNMQIDGDSTTWITGFKRRASTEEVRNCTRLPKTVINEVVKKITSKLLEEQNYVQCDWKHWNAGGSLSMKECADLLNKNELNEMKSQGSGVQTLLRNHSHIFSVKKGRVSLRNFFEEAKPKKFGRVCWFHINHPDGCSCSADLCIFKHIDSF